MKPALTGLVMLLLFTTLSAQSIRTEVALPEPVTEKFTLLYPDAAGISWVEQRGKYLAEFRYEKKHVAAIFKKDGDVVQIKTEINVIALPPEATSFLKEEIKCRKIEDASIIEDAPGVITFTATADSEQYRFDCTGRPLSSSNDLALIGYSED